MELSAFQALDDYVCAATFMQKYIDGLTELTEIHIHIPLVFP